MSNKFELIIVILIFCNMIVMAIDHYNQTQAVAEALEMMNIIFTTIFLLEAVVKIIGLRYHYFRFLWNIFDFIILIMSILGKVLLHFFQIRGCFSLIFTYLITMLRLLLILFVFSGSLINTSVILFLHNFMFQLNLVRCAILNRGIRLNTKAV